MTPVGFGDANAQIKVYVQNRPKIADIQTLDSMLALTHEHMLSINAAAGNGWRKVFNVYAKWLFELMPNNGFGTWQALRDARLLHKNSNTALLFSTPDLSLNDGLHVIAGRGYAKALITQHVVSINLIWLDEEFAIDRANKVIVCPYFDYRQLSNKKITFLCELIHEQLGQDLKHVNF